MRKLKASGRKIIVWGAATKGVNYITNVDPDAVLIDGKPVKKYPLHQVALVKGDPLSFSIAAASIIAKVTRDRIMLRLAEAYPQYGFEIHKGYPTPKHLAALKQHGPCPQHRRSFGPVAQLELDLG
jgi:ribonuclease HII